MKTVAFTRPADKLPESVSLAESMGMNAMAAPSLRILEGFDSEYDTAEEMLSSGSVDFAVFGSGTSVERCVEKFGKEKFSELFGKTTIVSIGPYTSKVLDESGLLKYDVMPTDDYSSYGILKELEGKVAGKTIMLVRSDSGSQVLYDGLEGFGAKVHVFASYRLEPVGMTPELKRIIDGIADGSVYCMAFTSPLSASSFFNIMKTECGEETFSESIGRVRIAAIGKPTAMRLTSMGRIPDIVPDVTTFEDMLKAIKNF
jgi:uroporphyrinogen-III synthase